MTARVFFSSQKNQGDLWKKGNCNVRRTGKAALRKRVFAEFAQKKPSNLYVLTQRLYAPFDKLLHIGPKQIFFVKFPKKTLQEYFDVVLFVKAMSKF